MRTGAYLLIVAAAAVTLAGCGQRGPLYLRDKPPAGVKPDRPEPPYRPVPYPAEADGERGGSKQ